MDFNNKSLQISQLPVASHQRFQQPAPHPTSGDRRVGRVRRAHGLSAESGERSTTRAMLAGSEKVYRWSARGKGLFRLRGICGREEASVSVTTIGSYSHSIVAGGFELMS